MKQVTDAVGRKWHRNIRMKDELISLGSMRVRFRVNRFGTPGDIRVVKRSTNTAVEDVTLRSILDAEIPPMPARVAEILDNGDLEVTYNVLIY
jgi:outer membrane biosynthesis protein TonB